MLPFLDHVLNHAELYKQNKCFCDQSSFPALTCKSVRFLQSQTEPKVTLAWICDCDIQLAGKKPQLLSPSSSVETNFQFH